MTYALLNEVADKLRKAGARVPLPEAKGTIESTMQRGLSLALVFVEDALSRAPPAPPPDVQTLIKAIEDYTEGKILLMELRGCAGLPILPEDKKLRTLAMRVKELEAEVASLRRLVPDDVPVADIVDNFNVEADPFKQPLIGEDGKPDTAYDALKHADFNRKG